MATGQGRVKGRLATILTAGMGRRKFMALLGGVATAWPVVAHTQQPKLRIVGVLGSATSSTQGQLYERFESRLRELGWIKGRNVAIEYRWAEGRAERYAEIANEFVRMRVSVIVTSGTAAVAAAKQATSVIPIVFAAVGDPVGTGLVASLARPGGNATGLSLQQTDLAAKRLELLREAALTHPSERALSTAIVPLPDTDGRVNGAMA
jgi:putative ABC transport system substrate-binding protein